MESRVPSVAASIAAGGSSVYRAQGSREAAAASDSVAHRLDADAHVRHAGVEELAAVARAAQQLGVDARIGAEQCVAETEVTARAAAN